MNNPLVINLFAGPSAGKSTGATYIFSQLKMNDINAEYVSEYAKDLAWERTLRVYYNQFFIGVEQYRRMHRLIKDCDVIVTDSPLLQQQVYDPDPLFATLMDGLYERFNNINCFIKRAKKFNPKGRAHNLEQAIEIDKKIIDLLDRKSIQYHIIEGNKEGYDSIVSKVLEVLK